MKNILNDMDRMANLLDEREIDNYVSALVCSLSKDRRVIGLGAGRMGYALRAFIMRLGHMGFNASMIGDTDVPRVRPKDVIIVNTSSGETPSIALYVKQAWHAGATVFTTTCAQGSTIDAMSHYRIIIPTINSIQLMKSPYEQFSMLLYDYIVMHLVHKMDLDPSFITHNHSILE